MEAPNCYLGLNILPQLPTVPEWLIEYELFVNPIQPKKAIEIIFRDLEGNRMSLARSLTKEDFEFYWSVWMLDPVEWVEHLRKMVCPTMGDSLVLHGGWLLKRL
ncbi:hypothetical protein DSECCO2_570200 [anaerobic digester metagenome]